VKERNMLHLKLDNPKDLSIGYLFGFLHKLKENHRVKDFDATQTTLEQIFNQFAKGL
jgi:hypothetical protein